MDLDRRSIDYTFTLKGENRLGIGSCNYFYIIYILSGKAALIDSCVRSWFIRNFHLLVNSYLYYVAFCMIILHIYIIFIIGLFSNLVDIILSRKLRSFDAQREIYFVKQVFQLNSRKLSIQYRLTQN